MPFQISWYIENEIVYTHYYGVMTEDELRDSLQQANQMVESSPREIVHAITDVGDVVEAVPMKESLNILREVGSHPRAGWAFTIRQKSTLVKMASAMGSSIFKMRYRSFDTLEETLTYLKGFDRAISWDKVSDAFKQQPIR